MHRFKWNTTEWQSYWLVNSSDSVALINVLLITYFLIILFIQVPVSHA